MNIMIIDYLRAPYDGTEESAIKLALLDMHLWATFFPDTFFIFTKPNIDGDQD